MKKMLALLLAAVMVLSLAACGGKPASPSESPSGGSQTGVETNSSGEKVVTIGVAVDLQSFDPANNDSTSSECILMWRAIRWPTWRSAMKF